MDREPAELQERLAQRERDLERAQDRIEFLEQALDSLPHPFYVIDARDYTVQHANTAAGAGALVGKITCHALTHRLPEPCGPQGHPCPLDEVVRTGRPVVVEHVHFDLDGNPVNVEVHGFPITAADGTVAQMIEFCLDITQRRHAEIAREKVIGELRDALAHIRTLSGLIPICASCKKIRDDQGYWKQLEEYLHTHSEAEFSHSICPDCRQDFLDEIAELARKKR